MIAGDKLVVEWWLLWNSNVYIRLLVMLEGIFYMGYTVIYGISDF